MKYFIIAGERSGDLHASNLVRSLKQQDAHAEIKGWGGELMHSAGVEVLKPYQEISFMGFAEVLTNAGKIFRALKECKEHILGFKPDVVILVDFAGFNLRVAKFAKESGIKVYYYISPKVWAWNQSRAWKIKAVVDKMFVILPFEKEFFKKYGMEVDYVGNPINDAISNHKNNPDFRESNDLFGRPIIALLPGSRKQEVQAMLDQMLEITKFFPAYQFVIAAVGNLPKEYYEPYKSDRIKVVYDQTYDLLAVSEAAVVTSGTATLETALMGVPQVVVYKANKLTYLIARMLIKVKYISLVNLVANAAVVKELIQSDFNPENIAYELKQILENENYQQKILLDYRRVKNLVGEPGASDNAARLMYQYLTNDIKKEEQV
ncbi:MAG TPA: lipid-A-disaccharide synthase [Cytophagaceae bacterium]